MLKNLEKQRTERKDVLVTENATRNGSKQRSQRCGQLGSRFINLVVQSAFQILESVIHTFSLEEPCDLQCLKLDSSNTCEFRLKYAEK